MVSNLSSHKSPHHPQCGDALTLTLFLSIDRSYRVFFKKVEIQTKQLKKNTLYQKALKNGKLLQIGMLIIFIVR